MEVWITSAVEDKAVSKALVLAGSLRRVRTAKKLVVWTSNSVSRNLRCKLKAVFDLVVVLEHDTPNGWNLEDYAKVEGLSLVVFSKCVYLSPNTLVLKNCDDMFERYGKFAAFGNGNTTDSSVFLFTPCLDQYIALGGSVHNVEVSKDDFIASNANPGDFSKHFNLWIQNNIPDWETLDEEYNFLLTLDCVLSKGLSSKITIVNFSNNHPLDMASHENFGMLNVGIIEKFAVEQCEKIYMEDVKLQVDNLYSNISLQSKVYKTEPIAIVGMSFRLPGSNNADELWDLLANGKEAIIPVPPHRWSRDRTVLALEDQDRNIEAGFLSIPVEEFDARFFGISGKEAELIDPQQRLLHEVAWEALEDAMIDPFSLCGTQTGVFVGSWLDEYKDMVRNTVDVDDFRVYMGTSIATGAARLSHFLETTGPSIGTESGCSSAIAAVDMACKSLRSHESSLALACGVNLFLKPIDRESLSFVVSPDGRCKTFDEGANGFGRAEGCAVLLMKRLSDAVRDEDNIWGLIRGSAITQEGVSKSLGTPTVHCESLAMELALKDAGVNPLDVSYIEAHGTGTPVGDPMEIAAITKVYSGGRQEPLVIGSVKTNLGHTESVSGITGIIKVLLSMKNERIPPHLNLKKLNPAINLDVIPAKIPLEAVAWPRQNIKPRLAGVSSFGITGTDGHAIIQEPPAVPLSQIHVNDERPLHIMKISAKSLESFQQLLTTYEEIFTSKEDEEGFADLAYCANTGRATFNHRAVIIAKDFKDAKNALKKKSYKSTEVQSTGSPLCFIFTGQGSQYPNMAANLYKTSPIFRDEFNACDQVLAKQYGINLKKLLWEGSDDGTELSRTLYSQTSIFCVEYCLLKLWESWGVKPDYVMGHSLGEFAAAVAAGALDFEDALMLVAERSRLIDGLPRGKMLVVKASKETVDKSIEEFKKINPDFWVDYAAVNSSEQTVVAGDSNLIEEFAKYCVGKSLKSTVLAATHAFHSRHMEPMLEAYRKVAQAVKPPRIGNGAKKYISGMEGKLIDLESINADYWVRHTREPVNFVDACKVAQSEDCSLFLELGPHPVLSALTMMNFEGHTVTCLPSIRRKEEDWVTMLDSLAKLYLSDWKGQIDWKGVDRYYKRTRVSIPFYPFNRKPVWKALESTLPTVHPLLGKIVPTHCGYTIFENRVTLKNTPFIQDHVIGNTVVFPGAAFMEMCLVGGNASVQDTSISGILKKPQRAVALKSLKIITPLAMYDSEICRLQTTSCLEAEDSEEIRYSVKIARHVPSTTGGAGEWVSHATAAFSPVPSTLQREQSTLMEVDIPAIQNSWAKADNINRFYERLPVVGLRFGPTFKSLATCWKSEKGMLFAVKVPEEGIGSYLIHPIVADAMLQAIMVSTSSNKKLQVPVAIGEFIWLKESASTSRYIYCTTNEEGKTNCNLLDEDGNYLACMRDVDLIDTTVKLMEGMIKQQGASMPKLWREVWKSDPGPLQSAYNFTGAKDHPFLQLNDQQKEFLAEKNDFSGYESSFYKNLCDLVRNFFLNAMYQLGWRPQIGQQFTLDDLVKLVPDRKDHFKKFIRFCLRSVADTGILGSSSDNVDEYYFCEVPPTQDEVDKNLQKVIGPEDSCRGEYQILVDIGQQMSQVFLGKVDPLQILFTDDPKKQNANDFCTAMGKNTLPVVAILNNTLTNRIFNDLSNANAQIPTEASWCPPTFRVLEIGAGTGMYTETFLTDMENWGKPFEYYFTDISASFFSAAEKNYAKYSKQMVYKQLNMEEDPLAQGFCPDYFDMIVAGEVLHVARDIRKTLKNLKCLLKPGGIFHIIETTLPDPRSTLVFGLLEGYWEFENSDLRPNHTTLTPEKWEQVLREINCDKVVCTPIYNNVHSSIVARLSPRDTSSLDAPLDKFQYSWLIFYTDLNEALAEFLKEKFVKVNRKVHLVRRPSQCTEDSIKEVVKSELRSAVGGANGVEGVVYLWGLSEDITNRDQSQLSLPLINVMQEIAEFVSPPRLYVVTRGTANVDGFEVTNPSAATLHGMIKSLTNENTALPLRCLDLSPDDSNIDQACAIFQELWDSAKSNRSIAFRNGQRFCTKLFNAKVENNEPLSLPSGCDRFQLLLSNTRLISDLEFGVLEHYALEENEVEVKVNAIALNFRDVFAVLKPIPEFEDFNTVGLDLSGVVTKVGSKVTKRKIGDRVTGINFNKNLAMPSHVKVDERLLVPLPANMTFAEGATLPAVFSTAFLCLIKIAKMQRGETVLIHTASGGVGLCAIQLAKGVGAEIIATAGSKRKQNYLRNLGIQHVFHSRTTQFGKQVLEVTNGRGVDIVLNSITGEGFKEASLSALARHGRFIEMSKLNVWKAEEVKELRPDVLYQIVDLTSLDKPELLSLLEQLNESIHADQIRPVAFERFDAVNIRGALNYLQKAKHIGKVVCVMPEVKIENSKFTTSTPQFNEQSTYLITGGLGGIGFEVVKWMLKNGAKHLAIVSRSSPRPEIASQLEFWNKGGKHVETFSVDIGDTDQCRHLFQEIQSPQRNFPPLRGVMHAAGILADATLENQTWSKYKYTYKPKVDGTWNLHDLTKDLPLEHFVVFSSIAASIGSPGQSNHAASNSFEDALVAYRRSNGLPGTTVNWGNWGEIGIATELDFPGIRPITTFQGILALETILKTQSSHLSVVNIDSLSLATKLFPDLKNYLGDKRLLGELKSTAIILNSDEFWKDVDNAEDRHEKLLAFKNIVKSTLRTILKIEQDEVIDDFVDFPSLGIDSLMMIEMKNGLQNIVGSRMTLTASQLKDCSDTETLSNRLLDALEGRDNLSEVVLPTWEELQKLIQEDSILPEYIRPAEDMQIRDISLVETVLLTGPTGVLGPYILKELCQRTGIKKIYCLVRKIGKKLPSERLQQRLQAVGLINQVDMNKVECIQGDVTHERFGLTDVEYDNLATNVDAIINCAVKADHTGKYYKAHQPKKFDLRTVNVGGTLRILEFAVVNKLKHVYHGSSLLNVITTDDSYDEDEDSDDDDDDADAYEEDGDYGCLTEEYQDVDVFDLIPYNVGYPLSKHVSEQLCRQAGERGVPIKTFRHPFIGGDSKTGRCDYATNHIILRWLAYLRLKCLPDVLFPMMVIPVDQCARISVEIFFNSEAPTDIYNIVHPGGDNEQIIIKIAEELGIHIKPVPITEFLEKLKLEVDESPLAPFKKIYVDDEKEHIELFGGTVPVLKAIFKCCENPKTFFMSHKLSQLLENYHELESTEDVIRRDLLFLKESGVFDKYGIK